jgi:hypothetical protein
MLKKIFLILFVSFTIHNAFSQVLYSERFNTLSLITGTYSANSTIQSYLFSDVPNNMFTIKGDTISADTLSGNYPFRASGQKKKAWLSYVPVNGTDTFAVSTSWLKPTGAANNWLITPTIYSITANSVLTWEALAPDINNQDGYEVYVATYTSTIPVVGDFTNLIFSTTAEKSTWQTHGISLAAFNGQNIRIGIKNNSTNKYQLWIDDISVANVANAFDVSTISQNVYKYSSVNALNAIVATFKNNGYTPITNLTIDYKMSNGVAVTETKIFSPALNYLDSKQLTFTIPYSSATALYNTFKIYPRLINGQPDVVAANDTITGSITISDSVPTKKVLVEEYTSTNCGWCPDGYTSLKSIVSTNTNVVAASIHDNDNMSNASGNTLIADYAPTFPSATIDQYYFPANSTVAIEKNNWSSFITQRLAMKVPATISVTNFTYNPGTQQIDATVSSKFFGDVKGDYRLNLYIKENNVYGPIADSLTDNQWNQYNNLYNISSSPYYQYGNIVNSNYLMSSLSYKHQYVINSMIDGAYGASGIIPVNGSTKGQTYSKNYSFTLPSAIDGEFRYNVDNIYLIGVLSEYNADTKSRTILNVAEVKLNSNSETVVGIKDLTKTDIQLNVFPNPTTDICYLTYFLKNDEFVTINVYNTLGELVLIETKNVNAGNVTHVLNVNELRSGNYSVQVSFKNNSITKKLTIIK